MCSMIHVRGKLRTQKIGAKKELATRTFPASRKSPSLKTPKPNTHKGKGQNHSYVRYKRGPTLLITSSRQTVTAWLHHGAREGQRSQRVKGICIYSHSPKVGVSESGVTLPTPRGEDGLKRHTTCTGQTKCQHPGVMHPETEIAG